MVNLRQPMKYILTKLINGELKTTNEIYSNKTSYQIMNLEFGITNYSSGLRGLWCLTPLSTIFQLYRGGRDLTLVMQFCKHDTIISILANFWYPLKSLWFSCFQELINQNNIIYLKFGNYFNFEIIVLLL
jgi:hypothetical protein